jgi:hypothetical protein
MFSGLVLAAAAATRCDFLPQLQLTAAMSRATVTRRGGSFSAMARVTLVVRTIGRTAISTDPGMRAHAAGYYAIARELAQRSDVRAIGATRSQAQARLKRTAVTLAHDANMEYAQQIHIYEMVTANGREQSQGPASGFPGGPNAATSCAG